MNMPMVSFIIPTLNAERTLEKCLASIEMQNFPKDRMEVVISDAGSTDGTLSIIEKFKNLSTVDCRLLTNPLKTGEAGKAVGIDASKGEILAFIDSDNVLEGKDWLKKMVSPFKNNAIFASEVLCWHYNTQDSVVDRYCALTGINDPICLFLGNYDRWSYLTGRWTGLEVKSEADKGDYLEVVLDSNNIPTMGANGFLIRKGILKHANYKPYYFDIDVMFELVKKGYSRLARPKIGIRHYFCDTIATYARKQNRRIKDYFYFKSKKMRPFEYRIKSFGFIKFIIYTVLIFPLLFQSIKGNMRKKDMAWFFHPLACWITLTVYAFATIQGLISPRMLSRGKWRQ